MASQINLANNHIHARGVEFIMSAVDGSRGVRVLYCLEDISFANNFAGPEGAAAIGAVMKSIAHSNRSIWPGTTLATQG